MTTINVYDDGNDVLRVEEVEEVPVLNAKGKPTGKTETRVLRSGRGWVGAMTNHYDFDQEGNHVGGLRPMTAAEKEAYVRSLLPEPAAPKPLMTI